ncbi:unnamed protein product [Kuraishia capsulata CBS 1993]|uniref:C2H2-type domain-containing protein n=1 Tax=Kuraishia capsulata CBS 1993 TaxID=1382522 RepID=W6MWA4_9ASCO|nr:uncharacterized protein KUCA_T00003077001 [Kuraishia capsulata CBS 1993]CDK27100.1 unnamed protein product [Kuraishia capsulata CBS 1993]
MSKRYICSFCARSFSRSEHKLRHERSHTKEKPFNCTLCHHSFVRRDLLQRHCRTVHGLLVKSNIESAISTTPLSSEQRAQARTPDFRVGRQFQPSQQQQQPSQQQQQQQPEQTSVSPTSDFADPEDEPVISSNPNVLTEKTIVTLLTLSKKFSHITRDLSLDSSLSNYLLVYGTKCLNKLPILDPAKLTNLASSNELFYLVVCIGACECGDFEDATKLFNIAWNIIIGKISSYEINYNSANFNQFIENLIVLCSISISYFSQFSAEQNKLAIQIDVLFEYLNNIISTQIANSKQSSHPFVKNYLWHAYILLSQYSFVYNKSPSSLHLYLLDKNVPKEDSRSQLPLKVLLKNLTMTSNVTADNQSLKHSMGFTEQLIICGLMNELQLIKFNDAQAAVVNSRLQLRSGVYDDDRNLLHNAIILANKSFNYGHSNYLERCKNTNSDFNIGVIRDERDGTSDSAATSKGALALVNRFVNDQDQIGFLNLLIITKRRLLLNCPLKYTDLLASYVFLPKDETNWSMLALTLKEFLYNVETTYGVPSRLQVEFDLSKFFPLQGVWLTTDDIYTNLFEYIGAGFSNFLVINNNLGITSLPLIFLGIIFVNKSLNKQIIYLKLPENKRLFLEFVVSNFLVLFRILLYHRSHSRYLNGDKHSNVNDDVYEDGEFHEEDCSMLSAILYAIKDLGANVDHGLENARGRSRSITIGEFINNKSKEPKVESVREILSDDLQFFFYFKNLEKCLFVWLSVLDVEPQKLERFSVALKSCLGNLVYSKLELIQKDSSPVLSHSVLDYQPLVSHQPQPMRSPNSSHSGSSSFGFKNLDEVKAYNPPQYNAPQVQVPQQAQQFTRGESPKGSVSDNFIHNLDQNSKPIIVLPPLQFSKRESLI